MIGLIISYVQSTKNKEFLIRRVFFLDSVTMAKCLFTDLMQIDDYIIMLMLNYIKSYYGYICLLLTHVQNKQDLLLIF